MTGLEIQKAVFAKLDGAALVTNLLAAHATEVGKKAIYDDVPQLEAPESEVAFPYVVLGDLTILPADTDSTRGRETTITIHTFSRYFGTKETHEIMDAIRATLDDATLAIAGEKFVFCFWEFAETLRDPDGRTRHGVQRFRLLTEGG
jgi:exonuclease III